MSIVKPGDIIIFDSVSHMSRNTNEGIKLYFELFDKGVNLVSLKEGCINTEVYRASIQQTIAATGNEIADIYIEATNKVIKLLAEQQIRKAFESPKKRFRICMSVQKKVSGKQSRMENKWVGLQERKLLQRRAWKLKS